MPRKPLLRTHEYPYHVTARSNNKEWFYLPIDACWSIVEDKLDIVSIRYNAQIIAIVLMSNHFHLLISTPEANLDAIMNYFMREVSRTIGRKTGRINHVFGGPYKWCLIRNENHLRHAYKYIYRNPVDARLSSTVETYPFSTARYLYYSSSPKFHFYDEFVLGFPGIPKNMDRRLHWLNNSFEPREKELIRRALRRKVFAFPRGNNDRRAVRELEQTP